MYPSFDRESILSCVSVTNVLRSSGPADLLGTSLGIRIESPTLYRVFRMVLGLTSIPNLYSIILRIMDVCHRADSKPYACGEWDSHTPITTRAAPASIGLWFGAGLSQTPQPAVTQPYEPVPDGGAGLRHLTGYLTGV